MKTKKDYFTRTEALGRIEEALLNEVPYLTYYDEIYATMFPDVDPYIIGSTLAKEALEEYGVYKAINRVIEYHERVGLEVNLNDFIEPEGLASALWSVINQEVWFEETEIYKYHDLEIDQETTQSFLNHVRIMIAEEIRAEAGGVGS